MKLLLCHGSLLYAMVILSQTYVAMVLLSQTYVAMVLLSQTYVAMVLLSQTYVAMVLLSQTYVAMVLLSQTYVAMVLLSKTYVTLAGFDYPVLALWLYCRVLYYACVRDELCNTRVTSTFYLSKIISNNFSRPRVLIIVFLCNLISHTI
jgi:hypothetical protein